MPLFATDTYERAKESGEAFIPYQENTYNAEVMEVKVVQTQGTNWDSGSPVRTDEMVDQVEITFTLIAPVDGDKILDMNGDEAKYYTMKFWFDPTRLGTSKRGPSKARQFLCALMGWDIGAVLNLEILEKLITGNELKDKPIKLYISLETGKDGVKRNKIERFVSVTEKKAKKA